MNPRLLGWSLLLIASLPASSLAVPVISTPSSLNYGNVTIGSSSNLTLSIQNTGDMFLNVTAITLSGSEFNFPSTPTTPFTVAPGGSNSFTVRFSPTSIGPKTGSVTIASNDPVTPSKVVSLSGNGVGAVISVPASLAFGNVNALSNGDLSLAISNVGNLTLFVSGMTFSGADASSFSLPGSPSFPLNVSPGGNVSLIVRFSPASAGAKTASLSISSNDPLQPTKAVTLSGTGVGPIITTAPGSLAFGDVHINQSADLLVFVGNVGGGILTIAGLSFTGANASSFSLVSPPALPIDLAVGVTVPLTVRLAPTTIGAKVANLELASNDVVTPTKSVALGGTGTRPEPVIAGVRDVPNDQGGRVKLSWDASTSDTKTPPVVDHYWIFRSVPPQVVIASGEAVRSIAARRLEESRYYTSRLGSETFYWELVDNVTALHFIQGYSYIAATLSDSTGDYNPLTLFMVMALDAGNTMHWDSAAEGGYSVDNLAPAAPALLTGSYFNGATHLHWIRNGETDLAGYRIYRGSSAAFVPGPSNLVGTPPDTGFADAGDAGGYYKLSAVDSHGNQSIFALLTPAGTLDVPGGGAMPLALAPPAPNPVLDEADWNFTLPEPGAATLTIYDAQGRNVRTVVHGPRPAGRQRIHWDGRSDEGQVVPKGVYFARLDVAGRSVRVRFALMR